jgi:protein gp37
MAEYSKIEWCDHTFNPWEGCTKVSPGCAHCYAEARNHRFGLDNWGKGKPRRRTSAGNWKQPLKWNRELDDLIRNGEPRCSKPGCGYPDGRPCIGCGRIITRPRVFCASLADWLDEEVPIEDLADLLVLMHKCQNLDWLMLSKRPENWALRLQSALSWHHEAGCETAVPSFDVQFLQWLSNWIGGHEAPSNVWIGTSVEDQERADERIPELLKIPAKVRFLSVEPLLEAVDLTMALEDFKSRDPMLNRTPAPVQWVIVGGESGGKARPCEVEWIRSIVQQCKAAGVACFVKQLGGHVSLFDTPSSDCLKNEPLNETVSGYPDDHRANLKDRKGGDWSEWPEDLRVREFPA